jgi:hypothetical protein
LREGSGVAENPTARPSTKRKNAVEAEPVERVYRYVWQWPELTESEKELGWPALLCGGLLVAEGGVPFMSGTQLGEMTQEDLERWGISEEPCSTRCNHEECNAVDAYDLSDSTMEAPRLGWMWQELMPRPDGELDSRGNWHGDGRIVRSLIGRGRPRKAKQKANTHRQLIDDTVYSDREEYGRAVVSLCERELKTNHPAIDVDALRRICVLATNRDQMSGELPSYVDREGLTEYCGDVWLPERKTFAEVCEWAFAYNLPPRTPHREIVVRAVEFLCARSAEVWDARVVSSSRPLALASLVSCAASGEELAMRGSRERARGDGWQVSDAIEAEERAIGHTMKKVAATRLALRSVSPR